MKVEQGRCARCGQLVERVHLAGAWGAWIHVKIPVGGRSHHAVVKENP